MWPPRRTRAALVLTVADDGRGISIADRCRLFQPFFTTKSHGTGLGLFVSRQILEDHAGTLAFRSEPGQGSTFSVRLPTQPQRSHETPRLDSSGVRSDDLPAGSIESESTPVLATAAGVGAEIP